MIHYVLIRHGETIWTKEKRYQGQTNTQLTARGRQQVRRFVKEISEYQPDVVFTSSLDRSKESANIICQNLRLAPRVDKRINELRFGSWEGKTAQELIDEGNKTYLDWIKGKMVVPKGGESIPAFKKRIRSFMKDCQKTYDHKKVVVVTHGGAIRMFLLEGLKLSYEDIFKFRIEPGTMTVMGVYQYSTQLISINSETPNKGIVPYGCV